MIHIVIDGHFVLSLLSFHALGNRPSSITAIDIHCTMKLSGGVILCLLTLAVPEKLILASAKKSSRSAPSPRRGPTGGPSGRSRGTTPVSSRRYRDEDEDDEDDEELGFPDEPFDDEDEADDNYYSDEEDDYVPEPKSRKTKQRKDPPPRRTSSRSSSRGRYDDDDYDQRRRPPSSRRPSRGRPPSRQGSRGRQSMVPYTRQRQPSAFSKGLGAIRSSMPDPSSVREAAMNSLNMARETTSNLSANLYREVKGLTSSELEQVMLKATRPDDTAVKGKHVERLVGVTYQISARFDIYDAVLRKLWSKMAEKDWRTTIKALYILHRFSADGAPEHAPSLKARLRELRRSRDPKRKDEKYFNSKRLLAGDNKPESDKYIAFMSRYAHYVLLRAQCFGGKFDEISSVQAAAAPSKKGNKKASVSSKPNTVAALRIENLEAAAVLLKAGVACQLKDGEECENTAIALERVAADLIALTGAVAATLNRSLKHESYEGVKPSILKKWCEFYGEDLLPQTRSMIKKSTPKLDAYGLFLSSRLGTAISQDLLQKGMQLEGEEKGESKPQEKAVADDKEKEDEGDETTKDDDSKKPSPSAEFDEPAEAEEEEEGAAAAAATGEADADANEYDEYEYEEEEYYDDEEPF